MNTHTIIFQADAIKIMKSGAIQGRQLKGEVSFNSNHLPDEAADLSAAYLGGIVKEYLKTEKKLAGFKITEMLVALKNNNQ